MKNEMILILDFGGQYKQLIARRVRECGVYCEIHPGNSEMEEIVKMDPKGIILTGGPNSVFAEDAPKCSRELFSLGIPVLGICYGSQLMAYLMGGRVETAPSSEYGRTMVTVCGSGAKLLNGVKPESICWMSHTDYVAELPEGFRITARTEHCPAAAFEHPEKRLYAVQFHPEVVHTEEGSKILNHFVMDICGCAGNWKMSSFIDQKILEIRDQVGTDQVLLGLSGGVDSAVTAALLSKAIGKQLTCVFVDHGLMRKNEGDEIERSFGPEGDFDLNFVRVNAGERFFRKLTGQTDPETKRKIIGSEFIEVFGEEAAKHKGRIRYIAQGTIYPDVVESGDGKSSDVIKSHHNVGGLPVDLVKKLGFCETPLEPLRMLFKDEVRQVGRELGLPEELISRQPFPGPGLAVRIVGEVTPYKVQIVQEADAIFREELHRAGADQTLGQYFAALSNMRSVGVMGDHRTYGLAVVLRAVMTTDFMTAEAAEIPWAVLQRSMNRIIGEVEGVGRVMYDLTSKPPGTIELE